MLGPAQTERSTSQRFLRYSKMNLYVSTIVNTCFKFLLWDPECIFCTLGVDKMKLVISVCADA